VITPAPARVVIIPSRRARSFPQVALSPVGPLGGGWEAPPSRGVRRHASPKTGGASKRSRFRIAQDLTYTHRRQAPRARSDPASSRAFIGRFVVATSRPSGLAARQGRRRQPPAPLPVSKMNGRAHRSVGRAPAAGPIPTPPWLPAPLQTSLVITTVGWHPQLDLVFKRPRPLPPHPRRCPRRL